MIRRSPHPGVQAAHHQRGAFGLVHHHHLRIIVLPLLARVQLDHTLLLAVRGLHHAPRLLQGRRRGLIRRHVMDVLTPTDRLEHLSHNSLQAIDASKEDSSARFLRWARKQQTP